jgi:hypothetical protein
MRVRLAATALAACVALGARAEDAFPARSGEAGILDVPDGRAVGAGRGLLGAELRFDQPARAPGASGPLPVYAVAGVTDRIDVGLTMREWGQPGDPTPARMVYGGAAKLQLIGTGSRGPAIALGAMVDRANADAVGGGRLIASMDLGPELQLAAFFGEEGRLSGGGEKGQTWGGALAFRVVRGVSAAFEYVTGPRGQNIGGAIRWHARPTVGLQIGGNYLPSDEGGFRVFVGVALRPPPMRPAPAEPREVAPAPTPEPRLPGAPVFAEARPRFRLRLPIAGTATPGLARRAQHGPWTSSRAVAAAPQPAASVRGAAPTLEDLAEAQVKDQEALADARERRVRATSDQLDAREKAAVEAVDRLQGRERELATRDQQLEARDKRLVVRGTPTQQERDLQSLELQLASQERSLLAQSRSYGPAIDAAQGRIRGAGAREDAERQEATRLAAAANAASSRAVGVDLRKQALAARNRQLAALETRLVAKGERIDALERQNRVTGDRLDAWQRRLDARGERLDVIERRLTEPRPVPAGQKPGRGAAAPADKTVFVMVVKSPTSIVKGRATGTSAAPSAAPLHSGVVVEKVVAGATVVTFPTPQSQLSELDQQTVDKIARLAARDSCELMIWARAKDPSLMAEAQRRAAEIKARVIATGPLDEKQVMTRITTRPAANGVDVVVTALRESAAPAPAAPAAPAPSTVELESGEAGKRQIRETIQAAQSSIEACVADTMAQRKLTRAEAVLKLTVSGAGKVTKVTSEGDLAGTAVGECLGASAARWTFPRADAEYVVDVPITVLRGEAAR